MYLVLLLFQAGSCSATFFLDYRPMTFWYACVRRTVFFFNTRKVVPCCVCVIISVFLTLDNVYMHFWHRAFSLLLLIRSYTIV